MKEEIGIVNRYDGYNGRIKVDDIEYVLLDKEIIDGEIIKENDRVSFIPEVKNDINIARFVKKVQDK